VSSSASVLAMGTPDQCDNTELAGCVRPARRKRTGTAHPMPSPTEPRPRPVGGRATAFVPAMSARETLDHGNFGSHLGVGPTSPGLQRREQFPVPVRSSDARRHARLPLLQPRGIDAHRPRGVVDRHSRRNPYCLASLGRRQLLERVCRVHRCSQVRNVQGLSPPLTRSRGTTGPGGRKRRCHGLPFVRRFAYRAAALRRGQSEIAASAESLSS